MYIGGQLYITPGFLTVWSSMPLIPMLFKGQLKEVPLNRNTQNTRLTGTQPRIFSRNMNIVANSAFTAIL